MTEDNQVETALLSGSSSRPVIFDGSPLADVLQWYPPPSRPYSRRELLADRAVNFSGVALGFLAGALVVYRSHVLGDKALKQIGLLIYALSMVTMLSCSAACHHFAWNWKRTRHFSGVDYMGISAMIAGSYTPAMIQGECWSLLAFVWGVGVAGTILDAYKVAQGHLHVTGSYRCVLITRFLIMGWCGVFVVPSLLKCLPPQWFYLVAAGGLLYTLGIPVFLCSSEFHLSVWHTFVIVASACMYLANSLYIVGVSRV